MYSIEGVVVFQGSDCNHWLMRHLKPGFKHCFVAIKQGDLWVKIDPIHSCTIVDVYEEITGREDEGVTVVHFEAETAKNIYRGGLCWFNCVEVVKSHIGVKSFWTWTPYQLYKLMKG